MSFSCNFYFSFILSTESYGQKQEPTAQLKGAHYHEHKAAGSSHAKKKCDPSRFDQVLSTWVILYVTVKTRSGKIQIKSEIQLD